MSYSDNFERREIKSVMDAYATLGSILNRILSDPDLDKLKGIKGDILSLSIHAAYMKNVVSNAHQLLSKAVPEEQRGEYSETKPSKAKIECEVHIMNSDKVCDVCGKSELEIVS